MGEWNQSVQTVLFVLNHTAQLIYTVTTTASWRTRETVKLRLLNTCRKHKDENTRHKTVFTVDEVVTEVTDP